MNEKILSKCHDYKHESKFWNLSRDKKNRVEMKKKKRELSKKTADQMIHRFMTSHPVAELLLCFGAKHQDGPPMLFGFFVILTHRLTEWCIWNAENVEKVYRRPFKQMSRPNKEDLVLFLTINIMQLGGKSWRVLRCFKTSVVNVLRLLRPLI